MVVTVKLFANFREAAGKDQEIVEGMTDLPSLLDELVRRFGNKFERQLYSPREHKVRGTVNVMINGIRVDLQRELKTSLKDGDVVAIFPPVAGGGQ